MLLPKRSSMLTPSSLSLTCLTCLIFLLALCTACTVLRAASWAGTRTTPPPASPALTSDAQYSAHKEVSEVSEVSPPTTPKADYLMSQAMPRVKKELTRKGLQLGQPVFMRIFKLSKQLELWLYSRGKYKLFKTYPICSYSGYIGPKLAEGDWQSPEGFYTVSSEQMNPKSRYHLSFNIGYPNRYDLVWSRTGSAIMVHGRCVSQGCFAMGNKQIEEIYLLAYQAFLKGQEQFSIHIFPFRMTRANLLKYRQSPWYNFWSHLVMGYKAFEQTHLVPTISTVEGKYVVKDKKDPWKGKRWVLMKKKKNPLKLKE